MIDLIEKYALVVCAAVAFVAGWLANGWRLDAKIEGMRTDHAVAVATANEDALRKYAALERQKQEAVENANKQLDKADRAARFARVDLDRLRKQSASIGNLSANASAADSAHARALAHVFGECAGELVTLASKADGHAIDTATVIAAWPRIEP